MEQTDIRVRSIGSLVLHWVDKSLVLHTGLVVSVLSKDMWIVNHTLPVYKVLSSLGYVEQFTEAALRDFDKQEHIC